MQLVSLVILRNLEEGKTPGSRWKLPIGLGKRLLQGCIRYSEGEDLRLSNQARGVCQEESALEAERAAFFWCMWPGLNMDMEEQ